MIDVHPKTQGITFASVHDSYWTHASSIDQMSEVIRDTFIALHSSDILRRLEAEVGLSQYHLFSGYSTHVHDSSASAMQTTLYPCRRFERRQP